MAVLSVEQRVAASREDVARGVLAHEPAEAAELFSRYLGQGGERFLHPHQVLALLEQPEFVERLAVEHLEKMWHHAQHSARVLDERARHTEHPSALTNLLVASTSCERVSTAVAGLLAQLDPERAFRAFSADR